MSQYPNLIQVLLADGFSEQEVAKICGGNLMRVWRQVEAVAAGRGAAYEPSDS